MPTYIAVLDACVLLPMGLCDTLLRAAKLDIYRLKWSEEILEETRRNLVEKAFVTEQGALRRITQMRDAFQDADAMVTGYRDIVDGMTNHPKDRHVLAAAVKADAQVIVTFNLRDFPESALAPHHIEAKSPDTFLMNLFDLHPERMIGSMKNQAADLQRPSMTVLELLDHLAVQVPSFVTMVKAHLG